MSTRPPAHPSPPDEPRAALVQRVASSATFRKTWRLRELLLFLCDRALRTPDEPPRESEIADAVFGRGDDFEPTIDPLVRVQTAQLRKRLHTYFQTEGAAEPVVIQIPRGAYTAAFFPREAAKEVDVDNDPDVVAAPPRDRRVVVLTAAVVALTILSGVLLVQKRGQSPAGGATASRPNVERLWRQLAGNGLPTRVVLGDASLAVFLDATRRKIMSVSAYQRRDDAAFSVKPQAGASAPEPPEVEFARRILPLPLTSTVDADIAFRVGMLSREIGAAFEVVPARNASSETFKSANVVIVGPRRANPWSELFEHRLNFTGFYDLETRAGLVRNRAPLPGEEERYPATPDQEGYCTVALLPSLEGTGSALLLTGTDLASTGAGIDFVTSEASVTDLARLVGAEGGPFPPFEVLLRVRFVAGAASAFERVAHRRH